MIEEEKAVTLKRRKAIAVVLVFVMLLTSFCWTTEKAYAATGNDIANLAIQIANGPKIPYVSGGRSLNGFDCCGFVWYVCNQLGVNVGTGNQRSQINYGTAVNYSLLKSNGNVSALQPGDLVFFDYTGGGSDHVGIYVGNGQMAHTSSSRSDVIIVSLNGQCGYGPWYSVVCGVRRVANGGSAPAVCTHTYVTGSESAHPHKEYKRCTKCWYTYYTGVNFAGLISSCSTCQAMSRKPAINVSVNGTTVNLSWNDVSVLHNYMYIRNLETGEIPFSKNMGKTLSQSVNLTPGKYRATVSAYYAAGEDSYTYSYVDFVVAGNTKPAICNHSYTTEYEAAHPHKEYKRCTKCGYTEYTGKNRGVLYCGYETEHPHRAYRKCTICGYYYNEDEFQKVSNCVTCNSQKIFKITIDPTGGTIIKGKETYEFNGEGVLDFSQIDVRKKGYKLIGWQVYFKNVDKWYSTKNGFKTKIQMAEKSAEIYTFDPSSKIHPHSNGNWDGEVNISLVVYAVWEKDSSAENICSHNYKISYGVSHPHKEYKICLLCGDVQYTGKISTSEDCKQCNPEEKKECQHTYEKRYEKLHPHEIYYQCSNCGEKYGTGQYTEYDDCDQCMEEKAKVTAVQITGKAYDGYIKLSWPGQTAISDYVIYRSTDGEYFEEYDETFENTYVDKNVKKGNAYYYYVIVQGEVNISDKSNICKIQLSSESKKEKICTSIENTRIKGLKAKKIGSKIKLTWDKSASKYKVDGYIVLRSTKKNTGYKQINTTTSKSCLTAKPKKGKTYYYMIYGYRIVDGKMINTVPAKVSIKG